MRRARLGVLALAAALGAVSLTVLAAEAPAEPAVSATISSQNLTPPGCDELTPEQAESPDRRCRDYLFQIRCQFSSRGGSKEAWEAWCRERDGLDEGGSPAVPRCDTDLAAQQSEIGMRCRDYLAATRCFAGSSSEEVMKDFCANVAPTAGPDPRPRTCNTALAHEPSAEGNRCWEKLKTQFCTGWKTGDNTGAQDINDFCDAVAAGAAPPIVDPACDRALATVDSDAGRACREQLLEAECETLNERPDDVEAFCREAAAARDAEEPASESPPEEQPGAEEEKGKSGEPRAGSPNVLLQLGREPACDNKEELDPEVQRACALAGSAVHSYPFANYGIDNNVSVDVLDDDFWSGETPIMSLFQWLMVAIWQALLWLLKIALLVVQWAFGIDPLSRSMDEISSSVLSIFNLLGPEWRLTAFAILGVWGFWNGLVRMRFMQTLTGLVASVLMMIGAMWIIYDPEGTVGKVAHYANESALVVLSASSSGEVKRPGQGLVDSQRTVFSQMVEGPWCALQFGGMQACGKPTADGQMTRAELWLSLPANSSARGMLYKATKDGPEAIENETDRNLLGDFFDAIGDSLCYYTAGLTGTCTGDEDIWKSKTQEENEANPEKARQFDEAKQAAMRLAQKDPGAVALQGSDGVFTRAGLLAVITIGMVGATAFLLSIGVRLVVAGLMALILILIAPAMLVVAAFGEEGRRRTVSYVRMLLGAAVAKLVYAFLLGIALRGVSILQRAIQGTDGDWLGGWLLVSAFFWVAVLQMNRILALFAPDPATEQSNGLGAGAALFLGQRAVSQAVRGAWQGATFLPRTLGPRVGGMVRRERSIRREATQEAIRGHADDEVRDRARAAHRREHDELGSRAEQILEQRGSDAARKRIGRMKAELRHNLPRDRREELEKRQRGAERELRRHEASEGWARGQLQRRSQGYQEPDEGRLRARRAERERDVTRWTTDSDSWSSESNRRWAGIGEEEWKRASNAAAAGDSKQMDALRERSEQALLRDKELLRRGDRKAPLPNEARDGALREWGSKPDEHGVVGKSRNADFAARQRDERRAIRRRGRENVRRNR